MTQHLASKPKPSAGTRTQAEQLREYEVGFLAPLKEGDRPIGTHRAQGAQATLGLAGDATSDVLAFARACA